MAEILELRASRFRALHDLLTGHAVKDPVAPAASPDGSKLNLRWCPPNKPGVQ